MFEILYLLVDSSWLISIKNMRNQNASDEINKLVMDDAIAGFVKNLG
jgi:hypothetical protein